MTVLNKYHYKGSVPEGAVNIMRGTPFGNPFVISSSQDRGAVIQLYKNYLWKRIRSEPEFRELVENLYGKDLCCCCAPRPCHGDVLEKAAEWLKNGGFRESQEIS